MVAVAAGIGVRPAEAATCTWRGNGNGNGARFQRTSNWSCGAVPGSSDDVVFDGSVNDKDCTLDGTAVAVNSVTFQNSYGSTVTGSSGTISVTGNWSMTSGTFTAGTGNISVAGSLSVGAGTFTGSSGTITVTGNLSIASGGSFTGSTASTTLSGSLTNAGTFVQNGGTLTLAGSGTITSGGTRLTGLTLNASGTYSLADRLWVPGGSITLTAGTLSGGSTTIHAGQFSVSSGTFTPSTSTVVLDGSSNQTPALSSFSSLRIEDPTETNLVGYWKLDEGVGRSISDLSGKANTGTLSSSGLTWTTSGAPAIVFDNNAALTFDGAAGSATLGATSIPATNGAVTIAAWVNLASTSGSPDLIVLSAGSSKLKVGVRSAKWTALPGTGSTSLTGASAATGWHHVAYTYNGSSVDTLYLDGVATTGSFTHQSGTTTAVYLGSSGSSTEYLNGTVDDVRIYTGALSAAQIAALAAGRYAGTGGTATVSLGAATSVTGLFALDSGSFSANGRTMTAGATASTTAVINTGTYNVGTAAQTFWGGLTVRGGGTLTLASSGGSVKIGSGQTLTVDGTLNASSTSATIQATSGTYTFKVGSTSSSTPTLNISGLAVKNTAGGMQIGAATSSSTTFTQFDNVAFSGGTGAQYLLIQGSSVYLTSNGCTFDAGQTTGGPTVAVTMAGNGTSDGETRAVLGGTTCATSWQASGSTACGTGAKSDDDADNNGVGDNSSTNGAVVQFIRAAGTDTAGSVIGFPTPAFDWSTFTYYSTYVAFHNASSGTSDVVYVRDESGNALYAWTVPTAGETITGTPKWITSGGTHYVYVATSAGKVYRLIDTATGTTSGSLSLDTGTSWATNPFDCSCTITTPLAMDATNLYWGSTTSGKNFWTLGQSNESSPTPVAITPTVTSAALTIATLNSGTTYAYMGVTGDFLKISITGQSITATNTSPGSASIFGRVVAGYNKSGVWRLFGGDSAGKMWDLDPDTGFATTGGNWSYATANALKSSPYYDHDTDTLQYGTEGGTIIVLSGSTGAVLNSAYPYTPAGGSGDAIQAAPLYYGGVLVVGSTGGKLYFLDRNTGSGVGVIQQYNFGTSESISGIGYDANVNRYMVSVANSTTKDGKLYYFDLLSDPTSSAL